VSICSRVRAVYRISSAREGGAHVSSSPGVGKAEISSEPARNAGLAAGAGRGSKEAGETGQRAPVSRGVQGVAGPRAPPRPVDREAEIAAAIEVEFHRGWSPGYGKRPVACIRCDTVRHPAAQDPSLRKALIRLTKLLETLGSLPVGIEMTSQSGVNHYNSVC
jgi:hypothetical protein